MGILQNIRTWWLFKGVGSHRTSRVYLVDTSAVLNGRRSSSRTSPAELVQTLNRLAKFTQKEQIKLIAIADGKPLREVDKGGMFNGIKVHFAPRSSDTADLTIKLVKEELRRHEVMVITSDRRLEERVMVAGGIVMRGSTFRKALDSVLGGGSEKSSSGGSRRRPRRRRPQTKPDGESGNEKKSVDPVSELIDVID